MTTIEGNKFIAEFDMLSKVKTHDGDIMYPIAGYLTPASGLKYHSSWDWLMPVVEKIESFAGQDIGHYSANISNNYCSITQFDWKEKFKTRDGRMNKIQATWDCIIQFIQWYNTQLH